MFKLPIIFFIACSGLLFSCSGALPQTPKEERTKAPVNLDAVSTDGAITQSGTEKKLLSPDIILGAVEKEIQKKGETTTATVQNTQIEETRKTIESINTLDDLKIIMPNIEKIPEYTHPKFIELQKASMKLSLLVSSIQDPKYLKLMQGKMNIYEGSILWTEELRSIDERIENYREKLQNGKISGEEQTEFASNIEKQNTLMRNFQATEQYKEYIKAKEPEITRIDKEIEEYYTPEVKQLQKIVSELTTEIYTSK